VPLWRPASVLGDDAEIFAGATDAAERETEDGAGGGSAAVGVPMLYWHRWQYEMVSTQP
jgi:hypothetical protein